MPEYAIFGEVGFGEEGSRIVYEENEYGRS